MKVYFYSVLLLSLICFFVQINCIVEDSNNDLVIGIVANQYDKYAQQDNFILDGGRYFMSWVNEHGGFKYPLVIDYDNINDNKDDND